MTTDTQPMAPTDAEIVALADETRTAEGGANGYILPISFARAVLAKWGAPAQAAPAAVARPSDLELLAEWDRVSMIAEAGERRLAVMRAVLAKWGAAPITQPAPQQEAQEPVMIYHGDCTIDCGEHGHHHVELLRMIPAGSKLYTAPQPTPTPQADGQPAPVPRWDEMIRQQFPDMPPKGWSDTLIRRYMARELDAYRAARAPADSVLEDAHALLQEVAACFTCDDDLPANLLPRIDAALAARKQGENHD